MPKGHKRLLADVAELMAAAQFAGLPAAMQDIVRAMHGEIAEQAAKVKAATAAVEAAVAADENCALLMTVPNLGPINAAALSIALDVPGTFRNGRAFAAALRLVPRQDASAERSTLRSIGRLHKSELRRYLVLAAQASSPASIA